MPSDLESSRDSSIGNLSETEIEKGFEETAVRERVTWIQSIEMKQGIQSAMAKVLESIKKLQKECLRMKVSKEILSCVELVMETAKKSDEEIKEQLDEYCLFATKNLRGSLYSFGWTYMMSNVIKSLNNRSASSSSPQALDFQQNLELYLRQHEIEITTDEACNWIKVRILSVIKTVYM